MKLRRVSWLIQGIALAGTAGAAECDIPSWVSARLLKYQAWAVAWQGIHSAVPLKQELMALQDGKAWLVYSLPNRVAYRITASRVSSTTCWHYDKWQPCLASLRMTGSTGAQDLVLGRVAPNVESNKACATRLIVEKAPHWQPSNASEPSKKVFLSMLSRIVRQSLGSDVRERRAVCNDYDIEEPKVWVIVSSEGQGTDKTELLLGVDIEGPSPLRMSIGVMRPLGPDDSTLTKRILMSGIPLELSRDE